MVIVQHPGSIVQPVELKNLPEIPWPKGVATTAERLALLVLAYRAHHNGSAWPTITRLALDMGMSKATASRALNRLVAVGAVAVIEEAGERRYVPCFVEKPNSWVLRVLGLPADATATSSERLLLLLLARRADYDTGESWSGWALLARESGLSARQARRAMDGLLGPQKADGSPKTPRKRDTVDRVQLVERTFRRDKGAEKNQSNLWRLVLPEAAERCAGVTPAERCVGVTRPVAPASPGRCVGVTRNRKEEPERKELSRSLASQASAGVGVPQGGAMDTLFEQPAGRGDRASKRDVQRGGSQRSSAPGKGEGRDALWDAVVEATGWDPVALTASCRAQVGKAVRELREVNASAELVVEFGGWLRERLRSKLLTPNMLATHWPAFVRERKERGGALSAPAQPSKYDTLPADDAQVGTGELVVFETNSSGTCKSERLNGWYRFVWCDSTDAVLRVGPWRHPYDLELELFNELG